MDIVPLGPLERGQLHVMRVSTLILMLPVLVAATVLDLTVLRQVELEGYTVPQWLLPGVIGAIALWSVTIGAARRWRHWGYAFTGNELHVAHGWWTQLHTIVPTQRVQHIDVEQGPLERMFGVSSLVLHTAGTENSEVKLPGIRRETAEAIRDSIRERIGSAPW